MKNWPRIAIIFPTHNGLADTKACLKSILELDYPQDQLELIIVDNASTDGTPKNIKKFAQKHSCQFASGSEGITKKKAHHAPPIRVNSHKLTISLIKNAINLGFAKAINQGIKKAKGEYFLITNNDVIFEKNYLLNLVRFLHKNPSVGIVGGKVYFKDQQNKIAFCGAHFNFYNGTLKLGKHPDDIGKTDWLPGCNMLIRKSVFAKIGLFDEKFFFFFEDLDLCLRAKKARFKVIYNPQAFLWHSEGASIKRQKWQKNSEYYYLGKTRILFKHASPLQLISCLSFQFLLGLPFHLLILRHQNYIWAAKALIKNIKDFTS